MRPQLGARIAAAKRVIQNQRHGGDKALPLVKKQQILKRLLGRRVHGVWRVHAVLVKLPVRPCVNEDSRPLRARRAKQQRRSKRQIAIHHLRNALDTHRLFIHSGKVEDRIRLKPRHKLCRCIRALPEDMNLLWRQQCAQLLMIRIRDSMHLHAGGNKRLHEVRSNKSITACENHSTHRSSLPEGKRDAAILPEAMRRGRQ